MKIKILSIKKRNILARWFSINHWRVEVLYKDKNYKFNVYAGTDNPSAFSLCRSIVGYFESKEKSGEKDIYKLIGKEII